MGMADVPRYKFKQIAEQVLARQWLVQAPKGGQVLLGRVVVNTGGQFRLYLYDGKADNAQPVAYIINPTGGQTFTYECALDHGIAYEVHGARNAESNPYSITITYLEL
jgi:hypothetical protein